MRISPQFNRKQVKVVPVAAKFGHDSSGSLGEAVDSGKTDKTDNTEKTDVVSESDINHINRSELLNISMVESEVDDGSVVDTAVRQRPTNLVLEMQRVQKLNVDKALDISVDDEADDELDSSGQVSSCDIA